MCTHCKASSIGECVDCHGSVCGSCSSVCVKDCKKLVCKPCMEKHQCGKNDWAGKNQ